METIERAVYSIEEAADYLRIDEQVVVRMAREKKIGSLKTGRVLTFPLAVLEAYVEQNTVAASTNPHGLTDASLASIRDGRSSRG